MENNFQLKGGNDTFLLVFKVKTSKYAFLLVFQVRAHKNGKKIKDKLAKGLLTLSFKGSNPQDFRLRPVVYTTGHISIKGP